MIGLILMGLPLMAMSAANEPERVLLNDTTSTDNLFNSAQIWEIHFGFTAESWEAMDAKFLVDPEIVGGNGLVWGGFVAPAFLSDGDLDHDQRLTKAEFEALGYKWFNEWGEGNSDTLNADQLGLGYGASMQRVNQGKFTLKGAKGERN